MTHLEESADAYNVQQEAQRFFIERLIGDKKLNLHSDIIKAASYVRFSGDDSQPFIPSPCKMTESMSALFALVASSANAVASSRYGIPLQNTGVNTDLASLFALSIVLPFINGVHFVQHKALMDELAKGEIYDMAKPIHRASTGLYKTLDDRWYFLHGSMNAGPTMRMVEVPEQDGLTYDEAMRVYADKVAQRTAASLEEQANNDFKQAGVTCLTPEEFFASEHGKIMATEPLWNRNEVPIPAPVPWPEQASAEAGGSEGGFRPLAGIKVIDFSRVVAAPVISKILAVLGADVLKIGNLQLPDVTVLLPDLSTGKRDASVDMKTAEGKAIFEKLVQEADVIVDGYRPGVLDRLGFSTERLREINPSIVVARENCYGWKGPLKDRSGWQQISDCMVGISWLQGQFLGLDEPVLPLLPNSDYQTGLIGAAAILEALLIRSREPVTFDIKVSLTQYNIWYYRLGQYNELQQKALLSRNEGFMARYNEDMVTLLFKVYAQLKKVRPELFTLPENFVHMSGKEWGLEEGEDFQILVPPFSMEVSELGYAVPSGCRGRSRPEW
ncbi:Acetyl-CoA oxalate CoA-transferase [Ceratocystis lukuohia]|uniref:Acetyl-CoA oxalate CoA-transferase n=1 Tax=Ceratocystis lukuohia TaxID=2019550 RepID=A0ABR4MBQ9_9PEZI